jgi:GNAT superfamily N-acetyltransferase
MDIIATDAPDEATLTALFELIDSYNDERTGLTEPARRLALVLREGDGPVQGGLRAITYYGWMFIEILFLPAALRGQGVGTRLMRMAEAEAIRRGCVGIWLDTFSFQARPFYERLGYVSFGQIDDYPAGHSRFFMQKRLDLAGKPRITTAKVGK